MRRPRPSKEPKCEVCPLEGQPKIWGLGNPEAPILIVGEAPGNEEVRRGRPFIGPSGKKLGTLLQAAEIASSMLYITNVCMCQLGRSKKELNEASACCRDRLLAEIRGVNPKVIVPLGNPAAKAIIGREGITNLRGQVFEVDLGGQEYLVVPSIHPAALLRHWAADQLVIEDLCRVKEIAEGKYELQLEGETDYKVLDTKEAVVEFFEEFEKQPHVMFDLETSGLDPRDSEILCISFSFKPRHARLIPLHTAAGNFFKGREHRYVWTLLREAMANPKVRKSGQNVSFDIAFMEENGCPVANVFADTLHIHHLLDENLPHSLDFLTRAYVPQMGRYWEELHDLKLPMKRGYLDAPTEVLWPYAMKDADATMRVYGRLREELQKDGLWKLYRKLTAPLADVLRNSRRHGMYVDLEKLDSIAERCEREIDLAEQKFFKQIGHDINLNSAKQLGVVLYDELGLTPYLTEPSKTHPEGQYCTDAGVLAELQKEHVCIDTLLRYRKLSKLSSAYLRGGKQGGLRRHVDKDSRVHPEFLVHGTTTGRLACRNPSLQNIPAREGADEAFSGSVIRSMFAAPPGGKLVVGDYEKAELWSAAYCSNDAQLFEDLRTTDVHTAVATDMFGVAYEEVTSDMRNRAKTLNFGIPYGREAPSVAQELGISIREAAKYIDSYFNRYKGYAKFRKRIVKRAYTQLYIENPFGRKRRVYGLKTSDDRRVKAEIERQVLAFPAQSTVADRINWALVDIDRSLKARKLDAVVVAQIHDEVIIETARAEDAEAVRDIVKEQMEKQVKGIAIPAEVKIQDDWGEKESRSVDLEGQKKIRVGQVPM